MAESQTDTAARAFSLDGRVALVTGGSRGIGRALAVALAQAGARVVVTARTASAYERVVAQIAGSGGEALAHAGHVDREEDVRACVSAALDRWGRLDVLVNNAGTNRDAGPLLRSDRIGFERTVQVNLRAPLPYTRAAVNAWMGTHGGSIINVASTAGLRPAAPLGTARHVCRHQGRVDQCDTDVGPGTRADGHQGQRARARRDPDRPRRSALARPPARRSDRVWTGARPARRTGGHRRRRCLVGVGRVSVRDRNGDHDRRRRQLRQDAFMADLDYSRYMAKTVQGGKAFAVTPTTFPIGVDSFAVKTGNTTLATALQDPRSRSSPTASAATSTRSRGSPRRCCPPVR